MKRGIDLDKAAEGEVFGALAVGPRKHRSIPDAGGTLTSAQKNAAVEMAYSLVEVARGAGAAGKCISLGDLLFELRRDGLDEVLSIRKPASR